MENIPPSTVLYKHVDRAITKIFAMAGPFVNHPLEKWLGVIRRGTYQSADE